MEDKGRVLRRAHGLRYVYRPVVSKEEAARHALQNVINTFFAGSAKEAIFFLSRNPDLLNVAAEEGLTDSAEVIREPTTP
jgi:predicted transcriptional regulator